MKTLKSLINAKYMYEFIGTFVLVFTVGMTVLTPNAAVAGFAPLAIGMALTIMVYAGGYISGGHYNPAVSLAVKLRGKLSWRDMLWYWLVQLLGAVAAAYLVIYYKNGATGVEPSGYDNAKAFIGELIFTFALCFVVLNTATAKATEGNSYFGLAIGLTIMVGAYAVGSVTNGAFNPAVVVGLSIMKASSWSNIWIYLLANFLGSIIAAVAFLVTV